MDCGINGGEEGNKNKLVEQQELKVQGVREMIACAARLTGTSGGIGDQWCWSQRTHGASASAWQCAPAWDSLGSMYSSMPSEPQKNRRKKKTQGQTGKDKKKNKIEKQMSKS